MPTAADLGRPTPSVRWGCNHRAIRFVATAEESYGAEEELLQASLPALDLVHNPARPAGPFEAAVWAVWPHPHQSGRIAHHA
jgi:hypothetical protein